MSDMFARNRPHSRLTKLKHEFERAGSGKHYMTPSTRRFLKVCPKLTSLDISTAKELLIDKECIIAHAETLRILIIDTGHLGGKNYAVNDLKSILDACARPEVLQIDVPDVKLGDVKVPGMAFMLNRKTGAAYANTDMEASLLSRINPLVDHT